MIYFGLFFMRLSRFHDSSRGFDGLTQLTWVFLSFFNWYFFLILSFNIKLIMN
jgi:hypothetical protein